MVAVFVQVKPLPCAHGEMTLPHWNVQASTHQRRLHNTCTVSMCKLAKNIDAHAQHDWQRKECSVTHNSMIVQNIPSHVLACHQSLRQHDGNAVLQGQCGQVSPTITIPELCCVSLTESAAVPDHTPSE